MKKTLLIIFVVIIGIILTFLLVMKNRQNLQQNSIPISETKTYTDPQRYFTITIPNTWQIQTNTAVAKTGIGTKQPTLHTIEIVTLASGEHGGITAQTYEEKPSCTALLKPNTTLAGLPASYDPVKKIWTLSTQTATFVIGSYYPGSARFHGSLGRVIPSTSQSEIDADQRVINSIITSFLPIRLQPPSC